MAPGLVIPIVILLAVPIVAIGLLRSDAARRRLEARIAAVVQPAQVATGEARTRRLRVVETRGGTLTGTVRRLIQVPEILPEARRMPWPVILLLAALLGLGTVIFTHLYMPHYVGVPIGIVAALLFVRSVFVAEMRGYGRRLRKQMPDMIELVISATLAGLPVAEGFAGVAREMGSPTKEEFQRLNRDIALGVPLEEAVMRLFRRTQVAEYAIFAVTLGVQGRSGGRLSEVIMRLADTIRQRAALAERAAAMAAEAKLSAYVLSVLPFVGATVMAVIQPGFIGPLLHDPRGRHLIFYGGVAMLLGWFTMQRMITAATSE